MQELVTQLTAFGLNLRNLRIVLGVLGGYIQALPRLNLSRGARRIRNHQKAGNIRRVLADIRKLLSRSIDTIVERVNDSAKKANEDFVTEILAF